jgi:hypothetical protein
LPLFAVAVVAPDFAGGLVAAFDDAQALPDEVSDYFRPGGGGVVLLYPAAECVVFRRFTILAVKKNGGGSPRRGKGVNANPTPIPV